MESIIKMLDTSLKYKSQICWVVAKPTSCMKFTMLISLSVNINHLNVVYAGD